MAADMKTCLFCSVPLREPNGTARMCSRCLKSVLGSARVSLTDFLRLMIEGEKLLVSGRQAKKTLQGQGYEAYD